MPPKNRTSPETDASVESDAPPAPPSDASTGNDVPPPPPGEKVTELELLTPLEWARRKGTVVDGPHVPEPFVKGFHASAAELHGWRWHAANFQAPEQTFRLSEADYDAALKAASEYPAKPAHAPALAPHYPAPPAPRAQAETAKG